MIFVKRQSDYDFYHLLILILLVFVSLVRHGTNIQIDRSVVESFGAGGRTCILSRVYPSIAIGKDAHLYVFNNGDVDVKVSSLTAWEMKKPLMNGA